MAGRILVRHCGWMNERFSCFARRPLASRAPPPPPGKGGGRLRSRRMSVAPEGNGASEVLPPSGPTSTRYKLLKPLGFTLLFSGCSFTGAAIWQYEEMRKRAMSAWQWRQRAHLHHAEVKRAWDGLTTGQRVAGGIIALNAAVFLAWRIPGARGFMVRYFSSSPVSRAVCWPMFLSTFSHYSFWHLGINMYVLYGFSTAVVHVLGPEQFLAVYLSAGVVSSFASYVHKVMAAKPGISLGASGCLMAILGIFCTQFPDAKLVIVFLPMFPFTAGLAIKGIMALDAAGLVLGWKLFDHAAHLGGALFGIGYALWGRDVIWANREPIMRWWGKLRGGT